MVILLTDEGEFHGIEASSDAALVAQLVTDLKIRRVRLTMPKFEMESRFNLSAILADMGMTDAFDGSAADFSPM